MLSSNWHFSDVATTPTVELTAAMMGCESRREPISSASTSYDRLSPVNGSTDINYDLYMLVSTIIL